MLGINKITVSDEVDLRGNRGYIVEVDYYFETEKDEFGLPSLDLSRDTRLYANFQSPFNTLIKQKLIFPTFLGTQLNPEIIKTTIGYKYPFTATFNIDSEESLNFAFEFQLFLDTNPYDLETRITLFSSGTLNIENDANIPIEDKRVNFYNDIFNFDIFSIGNNKNNSNVSDLLASYGKNKSVKCMFFIDKQQFLIDNSKFGKILNNSKLPIAERRKMLQNSSIANLKITRTKISSIRDFQNKASLSYSNQVPVTIAQGSEEDGIFATSTGIIESLSTLNLADIEYEQIMAFNDINLEDVGKHQYSMDMRMRDGLLVWLIDSLDSLTKIQGSSIFKKQKNPIRLRTKSYNTANIAKITNILFSLNSNVSLSQKDLKSYLSNLVKYEGSLSIFQSNINSLINQISTLIGNSGLISQTNSAYSKIYSKNTSNLFFLKMQKRFSTTVDFQDAIDLSYDYLDIPPNNEIGASSISKSSFKTRTFSEFTKLIKGGKPSSFPDLSHDIYTDVTGFVPFEPTILQSAYFNFEPNYNAFLSPVRIGSTTITNESAFNSETLTAEHFKKKYDENYTPTLSISYFLQQKGVSVGQDFFNEDPPLEAKGSTYFPANNTFPDADSLNNPAVVVESYTSGLDIPTDTNASFANTFLRNEEGWNLSRPDFDLNNSNNILKSINIDLGITIDDGESAELKIVREMPNQIRAIFASKSDKCVNQWLSPSMENDYIYDPNTYYTIKQNYMNLVKIEYLAGFKNDSQGIPDIRNPIFKKLTDLNGSGKIICRASIYNDNRFRIGMGFDKISYPDKYFIIDKDEA